MPRRQPNAFRVSPERPPLRPYGINRAPGDAPLDLTRRAGPPTPPAPVLVRYGRDSEDGCWHRLDGDGGTYCQRRRIIGEEAEEVVEGGVRCGECGAEARFRLKIMNGYRRPKQ